MKDALMLVKTDSDPMENIPEYRREIVVVAVDGDKKTAYDKITEFISNMSPPPLYLAHDELYPRFTLEKVEVL